MHTYIATVKDAPKSVTFDKGGEKIVVRFTDDRGSEIDVWGKTHDQQLTSLRIGQQVTIEQNGKRKRIIDVLGGFTTPQLPQKQTFTQPIPRVNQPKRNPWENFSNKDKQNMIAYIETSTKMYKHTFDTVAAEMQENNLSDENLRGIATTIYINTTRKFNV